MIIIGISGKKRTGKDTLCIALRRYARCKSVRIGFADALKEEVARACGVTVSYIENNKAMFRPILQWWGTDFRRALKGDTYWVERALFKMLACDEELVIVPDVRFMSEIASLEKLGAYLVRVARPVEITDTHSSETDLDNYTKFNHIFLNNGTLSDVDKEAISILQKLNIPN